MAGSQAARANRALFTPKVLVRHALLADAGEINVGDRHLRAMALMKGRSVSASASAILEDCRPGVPRRTWGFGSSISPAPAPN